MTSQIQFVCRYPTKNLLIFREAEIYLFTFLLCGAPDGVFQRCCITYIGKQECVIDLLRPKLKPGVRSDNNLKTGVRSFPKRYAATFLNETKTDLRRYANRKTCFSYIEIERVLHESFNRIEL